MRLWKAKVKLEVDVLILASTSVDDAAEVARVDGTDIVLGSPVECVVELVTEPEKLIESGWAADTAVLHRIKGEGTIKLPQAVRMAVEATEADALREHNAEVERRLQIPLFPEPNT